MAQTIQTFFTEAIARDFSRDFLFRVQNVNFGSGGPVLTDSDLVYAKGATLPERTIGDVGVKYRGLEFHVPGSVTYGNAAGFSLDFYCDADIRLRQVLLEESRRVFDDQTTTGDYNIAGKDASITLLQLDKRLQPIMEYKLIGCSIRQVGQIQYDIAGGSGTVTSFTATMAYHYFTEERLGIQEALLENGPLPPTPGRG
jgi:hypothetical protein